MIRRLLVKLIVTVLLVPCVLFAVMWIEYGLPDSEAFSYWKDDGSSDPNDLLCIGGQFDLWISWTRRAFLNDRIMWTPLPRFMVRSGTTEDGTSTLMLAVPLWSLAVLTSPPLVWALIAAALTSLRRRRWAHGQCGACGYDLRASAKRCPECGAPIRQKDPANR